MILKIKQQNQHFVKNLVRIHYKNAFINLTAWQHSGYLNTEKATILKLRSGGYHPINDLTRAVPRVMLANATMSVMGFGSYGYVNV